MNRRSYIIPKTKREKILRESIALASNVCVDQLDCSVSFARQPTDKTTEEVLSLGLKTPNTLYTFVYREHFGESDAACFDVGLSTICHRPDYFLWITLSVENGFKLVQKYKLKLQGF